MDNDFIDNWHSQLRKGLLPLFALYILEQKARYGYELVQEIKSVFRIEVAEGTLYPLLIRLMNDGLLTHKWVEQSSGIPRKYYSVTSLGKKTLKEMKASLSQFVSKIK